MARIRTHPLVWLPRAWRTDPIRRTCNAGGRVRSPCSARGWNQAHSEFCLLMDNGLGLAEIYENSGGRRKYQSAGGL